MDGLVVERMKLKVNSNPFDFNSKGEAGVQTQSGTVNPLGNVNNDTYVTVNIPLRPEINCGLVTHVFLHNLRKWEEIGV